MTLKDIRLTNVYPTPFNLLWPKVLDIGSWNCAIGRLKLKFWNSEHLITDVINDARTKGRTQSVCNTEINQVQQSDFIYSKSITIIRNSYKSAFLVCRIFTSCRTRIQFMYMWRLKNTCPHLHRNTLSKHKHSHTRL